MDRREFLIGLFGTAAVANLPAIPVIEPAFDMAAWQKAILEVHLKSYLDLLLYGNSFIRQCDKFPFIETIPVEEWSADVFPKTIGGLFET